MASDFPARSMAVSITTRRAGGPPAGRSVTHCPQDARSGAASREAAHHLSRSPSPRGERIKPPGRKVRRPAGSWTGWRAEPAKGAPLHEITRPDNSGPLGADAGHIDLEARPHGGRQADALDVGPLGAWRLGPRQGVDKSLDVGEDRFVGEA